ncbi:MAG TPA: hypothetical protein VN821_07950 [Candidatus Udaeobacter sp.]|nr:hypothetical protein [Candidatus Udaeobacter sp.]
MATVLAGLWIGDRLLSPIRQFMDCRREVQASLVVAFSLRNTAARLAGNDDIEALNALGDACRDLGEEAGRLEALARRPALSLRLYVRLRGYRVDRAAQGLRRLSVSLVGERRGELTDRAAVEAALRLGPGRRSDRIHSPLTQS